jgi:hypothetical protein
VSGKAHSRLCVDGTPDLGAPTPCPAMRTTFGHKRTAMGGAGEDSGRVTAHTFNPSSTSADNDPQTVHHEGHYKRDQLPSDRRR